MQISKLVKNHTFSGLLAVLIVAMFGVFINKSDTALEQRVSDLENRVTAIEEALSETETIGISDKRWQEVEIWRQLRVGMSEKQVQELLGRPLRVNGGAMARWYYSEHRFHSYVVFQSGKLFSWTEPR